MQRSLTTITLFVIVNLRVLMLRESLHLNILELIILLCDY